MSEHASNEQDTDPQDTGGRRAPYIPEGLPEGHVHACLTCTPDLVPTVDHNDPRYHDGPKCRFLNWETRVNGEDPGYTKGVYEGREGWALVCGPGYQTALVHECLCGSGEVCVTPVFGEVTVRHEPRYVDAGEVLRRAPGPPAFWTALTAWEVSRWFETYETFLSWLHHESVPPAEARGQKAPEPEGDAPPALRIDEEVEGGLSDASRIRLSGVVQPPASAVWQEGTPWE